MPPPASNLEPAGQPTSPPLHAAPPAQAEFAPLLQRATKRDPALATDLVATVLRLARDAAASDIHLDPTADALSLRWRLDGVLQPLVALPKELTATVIARLKVLAGLLTYETSRPQEGRIWDDALRVEVRVSTFPTLYGERAVLRLLGASRQALDSIGELGLPPAVLTELERRLTETSGAILIVGPAGSGKTTSAYACLRYIAGQTHGGRSIASLEDPVEVAVEGVAQSQVNPAVDFDMASGLRGLLRLDPEVILIGEMRDRATAQIALEAALTGQLVITTFHAGSCHDAIHRLIDIGVPAYAVRNAVRLVVAQRLMRRLCKCARPGDAEHDAQALGIDVARCWVPGGCDVCHQTGYRGRALVAEWRVMDFEQDEVQLAGEGDLWTSARSLIEDGTTSPAEAIRVLGLPTSTA